MVGFSGMPRPAPNQTVITGRGGEGKGGKKGVGREGVVREGVVIITGGGKGRGGHYNWGW